MTPLLLTHKEDLAFVYGVPRSSFPIRSGLKIMKECTLIELNEENKGKGLHIPKNWEIKVSC